uniref:Uncharacterized protein n=1 Tax=Cannabis sativa TaxID=3483 RepID=A0A803NL17_CANSA
MRASSLVVVVLMIIFCCGMIMSSQGIRTTFVKNENDVVEGHHELMIIKVKNTDDIRPTAPGHSPGAGHNHGPSTVPNSK